MTVYRSCVGCASQAQPCPARDTMRASLKGLGVTTVKWKCKDRAPRFAAGDPVWALTVEAVSKHAEDGEPSRDYFPATVIRECGTKILVVIKIGAEGRGDFGDDRIFESNTGFCKIPLSRLSPREADKETVCPLCEWPASIGHQSGYACNPHQETP